MAPSVNVDIAETLNVARRVRVVMLGAFPPPVRGMPVVNAAVLDRLRRAGVEVSTIDLAARNDGWPILPRSMRLLRICLGLFRLLRKKALRGEVLYLSVSGGLGKLHESVYVLLGRLRGMRIFLHHHSFSYIDKPNWIATLFFRMFAKGATHIVLCRNMADGLQKEYAIRGYIVLSNAVFFPILENEDQTTQRSSLRTVGFLSNICAEKGVYEFLDLMRLAREREMPLRGKIAGPFLGRDVEKEVRGQLEGLPNTDYVGPVYGEKKREFLAGIDTLVFPTRYINEAEPLILHEAMSSGLPVIAYGRGCIPQVLDKKCGKVIAPNLPFVPDAIAQLEQWLAAPEQFQRASIAALAAFRRTNGQHEEQWQEFLRTIVQK
jgi:glycosyltransferase involved in cell wall biosynthesis